MAGGRNALDAYIGNTPEINSMVPLHQHYDVDAGPEVSGAKVPMNAEVVTGMLPRKSVWRHHELLRPDLYRSEGYNEVLRPFGYTHAPVRGSPGAR